MDIVQLKQQLDDFNAQQKAQFHEQSVTDLLRQRSHFYDALLLQLWQAFGFAQRADLCLVAVGGYGRKEMFPLSDLDILVLCQNPLDETTISELNSLFNLFWDMKLQVGSAVRTIEECIEIGKNEISVATNMLESRFLTGNHALWEQLIGKIFNDDFWAIHHFYQAKMTEKTDRYARYHNTSYNLEPDLKHSPGGLRDLHLLSWIMLRHYGEKTFEGLLNRGILFNEEYQELIAAQYLLFKMRFALHLQLKRYDNRLRFDRQVQLAEFLGYQGEGNLPVETMMREFFQATRAISELTQLLLAQFQYKVLDNLQNIDEIQPLDEHFSLQNQWIFAENRRCFKQDPLTILKFFIHLTQHPNAKIHPTTLRHLRLTVRNLKEPLSQNAAAREYFIQLFSQPNPVSRAVVLMHRLGVLNAYLPQWKGIEGLMQFDMFHIYTVDEHTIRVMLKMESFLAKETILQHPLCYRLFNAMSNRPLLYLATLFHDIAKGRNGDHAELGAVDMMEFAHQHGFNEEESQFMAWLVAQHLTMSTIAQRRDIHDPQVVENFAKIVENQTALNALTCLTIADICATNETLWNDWKRTLFGQLYKFTLHQLDASLDYHQISVQHRNEALDLIKFTLNQAERKQLRDFWADCPDNYFLRNTPKQLVWHALACFQQPLPIVLVSNEYARGQTEIFVHCQDQPQLFSRIAHTLSKRKVNIYDAQIITGESGKVLDSFIVSDSYGKALSEMRCQQIQQALIKELTTPSHSLKNTLQPIKHPDFRKPTLVRFLPDSAGQTVFELFTPDREGLLAQISQIFNEFGFNLINAKITTIGERVEDLFVICNGNNQALSETEKAALKEKMLKELER